MALNSDLISRTPQFTVPTCHPSPSAAGKLCYWTEAQNRDGIGGKGTHPADPRALTTRRRLRLTLEGPSQAGVREGGAPPARRGVTRRRLRPPSPLRSGSAGWHRGRLRAFPQGRATGRAPLPQTPSSRSVSLCPWPARACAEPGVAGGRSVTPHTSCQDPSCTNRKAEPEARSHAEGHDWTPSAALLPLASATSG